MNLTLNLTQEEDYIFAEVKELNVCGTGPTLEEAVRDLGLHLDHFRRRFLGYNPSKLMGEAVRLKELYGRMLEE